MIFERHKDDIRVIASKFDGPFYLYSREQIAIRIQSLRSALPRDLEVFYSLKANSHPEVLKITRANGLKADVASVGELQVAIQAGFQGSEIEFTGPGKTSAEIKAAIQTGATLIIESVQELLTVEQIAASIGAKALAHVRLQPTKKINHVGRTLVNEFSQFGVDEAESKLFVAALAQCQAVEIVGTHTHVQSQILNTEFAIANFREAAETAALFASKVGSYGVLKTVNLGGGLGIPYTSSDTPVSIESFGQSVRALCVELKKRPEFKDTIFQLEFGRFIVGEAGVFVTKVLYTKSVHGEKVAITDGGFTQSQIACGAGQTIRRNLPIRTLSGTSNVGEEVVTVVGPSCYGADVLARELTTVPLSPGDLVIIENVGAYGLSFSPGDFLRQRKAGEFFV